MNKLFNWTFGSIFRTIGRVIGYLLIGSILCLIIQKSGVKLTDLLPIMRVSAKTFTTTENYRVRRCQAQCACDCTFTSWTSNGTSTSINTSSYVSDGLSMNLGTNDVFYSGTSYRVYNSYDFSGSMNFAKNPYNFNCFGATSNSTSGGEDTNIQSCTLVGVALKDNNITYVFDVVPLVDIKAIKINIYFSAESWTSIKGNTSKSSVVIDTSASDAINNQTDELLQNQNTNTQNIINNQNTNSENEIASNNVCKIYDNSNITNMGYLGSSGQFTAQENSNNRTSNFIAINSQSTFRLYKQSTSSYRYCFYDKNSTFISCGFNGSLSEGANITIPSNARFLRITIHKNLGPQYELCSNGNQAINDSIDSLNNSINDDDVSTSTSEASNFFSSFTTNDHGLTGIITAPLNAINSLTNASCSPLVLPLPFVNQNLTLPCMRTIYVNNFGAFMNIYDVIINGIVAYWVCVRIFGLVKDFKNPEHDEIEVVDL